MFNEPWDREREGRWRDGTKGERREVEVEDSISRKGVREGYGRCGERRRDKLEEWGRGERCETRGRMRRRGWKSVRGKRKRRRTKSGEKRGGTTRVWRTSSHRREGKSAEKATYREMYVICSLRTKEKGMK